MQRKTAELIAVLRKTLEDVQDSVWNDSPSLQELKRSILHTIADLEADLEDEPPKRH